MRPQQRFAVGTYGLGHIEGDVLVCGLALQEVVYLDGASYDVPAVLGCPPLAVTTTSFKSRQSS